jgi:hypothetical protein
VQPAFVLLDNVLVLLDARLELRHVLQQAVAGEAEE